MAVAAATHHREKDVINELQNLKKKKKKKKINTGKITSKIGHLDVAYLETLIQGGSQPLTLSYPQLCLICLVLSFLLNFSSFYASF